MQNFLQSLIRKPTGWQSFWQFATMVMLLMLQVALQAQQVKPHDHKMILDVMQAQETAWNQGDLEGFMQGYWHDDSLRFIGKSGITFGWQPTLDNYKKGYPDRAAMGKLTFTILRVESLARKRAYVTGAWHLQRAQDAPQGYFTLLWRKIHGKWVIVADHSS